MASFLTDKDFTRFRDLIYNKSGISFSDSNRIVLESRLREKLYSLKMASVENYYSLLLQDEEEVKEFLDLVTTNLTRFFRNQAHFNTLSKFILPNLMEHKRKHTPFSKRIRIWSAGCSTGEEPYSLAIQLKESLSSDFTFEVYASDLSLKSLMIAKRGVYPSKRVHQEVPKEFVKKYFSPKGDDEIEILSTLRSLIQFDYHNLKHKSNFRDVDIVFCRNVLIYFDEASQRNTLMNFWNAMMNHSFLFIGHSESLFALNVPFKYYKTPFSMIYIKDNQQRK